MRLLPETIEYENTNIDGRKTEVKQGYKRVIPYIETIKGQDVDKQAIRVKQLFYDFDADYCVIDYRNGGSLICDRLSKVLYDESRHEEYQAWTCFNDEKVANRIRISGAKSCIFVINASAQLNSDIAVSMREVLVNNRIDFLISHIDATDEMSSIIPEYRSNADVETLIFYDMPYTETQALFNEMMALEYEILPQTKLIRISETGANTKDRYTSLSYGSYFSGLLEQDLLSENSAYSYDFSEDYIDVGDDDYYHDMDDDIAY